MSPTLEYYDIENASAGTTLDQPAGVATRRKLQTSPTAMKHLVADGYIVEYWSNDGKVTYSVEVSEGEWHEFQQATSAKRGVELDLETLEIEYERVDAKVVSVSELRIVDWEPDFWT